MGERADEYTDDVIVGSEDDDDDDDDAAALKSTSTPQIPQLEWWREQTSTQMM